MKTPGHFSAEINTPSARRSPVSHSFIGNDRLTRCKITIATSYIRGQPDRDRNTQAGDERL